MADKNQKIRESHREKRVVEPKAKRMVEEETDEGLDGFDVIDLDGFDIIEFEDEIDRSDKRHSKYIEEEPEEPKVREKKRAKRKNRGDVPESWYEKPEGALTFGRVIGRLLAVILSTLLVVLVFVVLALAILFKGPSEEARRLMTLSCHETSAMKWLPTLFMSTEDYNAILNPEEEVTEDEAPAEKFVALPMVAGAEDEMSKADDGSVFEAQDESLPELEVIDINGGTFKGKMMIVRKPERVKIAAIDHFGGVGWTLSQFLEKYDAIGCTNAGGFEDENGKGKGGIPDGLVIQNGQIVYGSAGSHYVDVVGFDANHMLHVGNMSGQDALNAGIVDGASFQTGPVLIKNGERQSGFVSGINPRTCIGQTADGTVLLIAVEGRMPDSLGATFEDMTDILEKYGAINAGNFDGGSSSGMYYEGERITRSCSVIGDRPLPTAVIVTR